MSESDAAAPRGGQQWLSAATLLEAMLDSSPELSLAVLDDELRIVRAHGMAWTALRQDGDLSGCLLADVLPDGVWPEVRHELEDALCGFSARFEYADPQSGRSYAALLAPLRAHDGTVGGVAVVTSDDTSERRALEALQRRVTQQRAVARLGERALEGAGLDELVDQITHAFAEALEVDFTSVLELVADEEEVVLRAGAGWPDGTIGRLRLRTAPGTSFRRILDSGEPLVIDDLTTESRFVPRPDITDLGAKSAVVVPVGCVPRPWGLLAVHSRRPGHFDDHDLAFVQATANVLADAIARRDGEERLRHQALHDSLTGLPNRTLLRDRLDHALSARDPKGVAVLFIDVDDFKLVNDTLGHPAGDRLLQQAARRLSGALRPNDTVARFGGDEFVVVADGLSGVDDAMSLAARVSAAFEAPFDLGIEEGHSATASVGLRFADDPALDADCLLRDADAALYAAKRTGRGRIETLDDQARTRAIARMAAERDLRRGIEQGELVPHFQPIVDLQTRAWLGGEALARWRHPERGLLAPPEFIALAQETGLIVPLGEQILRASCHHAATWPEHTFVSVNVASLQLTPELGDTVAAALADSGLAASRLILEITEGGLIEDDDRAAAALAKVKALGVKIALDDFGTGYSALTHLQRFPIDYIKVDREFVAGIPEEANAGTIVKAILGMAWALGLMVIPEGIENPQQAAWLRRLGCRRAQGYLFSRPLPASEFGAGIREAIAPADRSAA